MIPIARRDVQLSDNVVDSGEALTIESDQQAAVNLFERLQFGDGDVLVDFMDRSVWGT